jgi:hypothetical protein
MGFNTCAYFHTKVLKPLVPLSFCGPRTVGISPLLARRPAPIEGFESREPRLITALLTQYWHLKCMLHLPGYR